MRKCVYGYRLSLFNPTPYLLLLLLLD